MLIEKIREHNEVNGFLFSACELFVVAMSSAPFGIYYLLHARILAGVIAIGIAANALVIVALSLHSLLTKQKDIGVLRWLDRDGRALIASGHPNITPNTLMVAGFTLVPFALLSVVIYESEYGEKKT